MLEVSDEVFAQVVRDNITVAGILRSIKAAPGSGNYQKVMGRVALLGLGISHWRGRGHGTTSQKKLSAQEVLVQKGDHTTSRVKKIILRENLLEYACALCGMRPVWNNHPLVLRLDHKNGIRNDHRLENLRFLCPNCDSQTETFCGRNNRKNRVCSCASSSRSKTKIEWPSSESLREALADNSYERVALDLGVSSNAIRKHLRTHA